MAAYCSVVLLLVVHALSSSHGQSSTDRAEIRNLRTSRVDGARGRFLVSRAMMEEVLRERSRDNLVVLASTEQGREYDTEEFTELSIFFGDVTDSTLLGTSSKVLASGPALLVTLPVVGPDGYRFNFILDYLTYDTPFPIMSPIVTNYNAIRYIFDIDNYNNQLVFLSDNQDGDILLDISGGDCQDERTTGYGFDESHDGQIRFTNYPLAFDWGCDTYNFAFCQSDGYLQHRQQLLDAGNNVCTTMEAEYSRRCSAFMEVAHVSGRFREMMPYLASVSDGERYSLEAERLVRENTHGLVFPCIT